MSFVALKRPSSLARPGPCSRSCDDNPEVVIVVVGVVIVVIVVGGPPLPMTSDFGIPPHFF